MDRKFAVGIALALSSSASHAHAHISLEQGGTHMSRYGDGELKDGPCGRDGGARGTHVYTYAPGETITVSVVEFVSHSGYFRIAFDQDGDDDFEDPVSIAPENGRTCTGNANDHCGESDFFNNDAVLMDNLEPHAGAFGQTPTYTWEVTLPEVACDNCTLQIIQVMTEAGKAPYDPSSATANDLYYQCIDLVLEGEPQAGGSGGSGAGGEGGMAGTAGGAATSGNGADMPGASGMGAAGAAGGAGASGGGAGMAAMPMSMAGAGGTAGAAAGTAGASGLPMPAGPLQVDTMDSGGCRAIDDAGPSGLGFALSLLFPLAWLRRRAWLRR